MAHDAGKPIQVRYRDSTNEWSESPYPTWDFFKNDYREKPTAARIPLEPDVNLCGKFIRKADWFDGCADMIISVRMGGVFVGGYKDIITFTELMEYVFTDGTPCSKEAEV